jgi:alkylated DNA repair dioxygenase AlkB
MTDDMKFSNNLYNYIRVFKNSFSKELCDKIINEYSNTDLWREQHAYGDVDHSVRRVKGINISIDGKTTDERKQIDQDIFLNLNSILKQYVMKFPLLHIDSDTGYVLLQYNVGDYYKLHIDQIPKGEQPRLISCIICLNDDYTGGEISFFNKQKTFTLKKGDVLLFPSNFIFPHEVCPILTGTRYSIITWLK